MKAIQKDGILLMLKLSKSAANQGEKEVALSLLHTAIAATKALIYHSSIR
jgi:hypothetical protein